ncbi:MAG: hypothetical protein JXA99_08725 [Candidatus Lokiarchaeota archaeon]|nr:hypothetical protein [Candidatus Lokiarchaeota archaeon]
MENTLKIKAGATALAIIILFLMFSTVLSWSGLMDGSISAIGNSIVFFEICTIIGMIIIAVTFYYFISQN